MSAEPAPSANHRAQPRLGIFLSAVMLVEGAQVPVRIRNLSREGALVDVDCPPAAGTIVTLRRGELAIDGTIAWRQGDRCGLRFDRPMALGGWMPALARKEQLILDQRLEAARRHGVDPAPAGDPAADHPMRERLAEELRFSQRRIATALDAIANYPPAVMKLHDALQELEVTAQALGHVASLLEADDAEQALARIGMDELKRRLNRR